MLGKDHVDVARSYNNMANVYEAQGKYGEALKLYEQSLAINIKVFGNDHPKVAELQRVIESLRAKL